MQIHAVLNIGGQGTSTPVKYNLISDTNLDITWYDNMELNDTNNIWGGIWQNHVNWASAFSVDSGGNGYDERPLPTGADETYIYGYDGTTGTLSICRRRKNIDPVWDMPLFPVTPGISSPATAAGAAGIRPANTSPLPCVPDSPF